METRAPRNIEEAVSEVTLTPRSPILQDMIGQRLLDIGFYIVSQLGKSSMTRDERKQQLVAILDAGIFVIGINAWTSQE